MASVPECLKCQNVELSNSITVNSIMIKNGLKIALICGVSLISNSNALITSDDFFSDKVKTSSF